MKSRRFKVLAIAVAAVLIVALGFAYHGFMAQKIYDENTENLISTYEQMDKTFELFAQRNWNVLADWDALLAAATEDGHIEDVWIRARSQKNSWRYRDIYLFNQNNDFITDGGRSGKAGSIDGVFQEMYEKGTSWISSYIASDGARRIVFALPLSQPFTFEGVTYTGLAVSYDNDTVMDMVAGDVYRGKSDCYVVRQSGDVVFSLQPKSEIKPFVSNIMAYLGEHASFSRGSFDEIQRQVGHGKAGSAFCTLNGCGYYLVYQPAGIGDWSIVGLVRSDVVDSGMNEVKLISTVAIGVVGVIITALLVTIVVRRERADARLKDEERQAVERQRRAISQLLGGMERIVDRFVVVDLVDGTYEYRENQKREPQYALKGDYADLLKEVSARYVVFSETEDTELANLLAPERLREMVGTSNNVIKIEYCARSGDAYKDLSVVPIEWGPDGMVTRLLAISQDIGQRVELETMANTDGLTGLFNGRYFSSVLHGYEMQANSFTLFYLDLDRFKPVNDTYGHDMGDKLLKAVASRLRDCIRQTDFAFRIGGDEFALVMNGSMDDALCHMMIDRIDQTVRLPFVIDGVTIEVGASCGWAVYPDDGGSGEVRILADRRMYECKERNHARS